MKKRNNKNKRESKAMEKRNKNKREGEAMECLLFYYESNVLFDGMLCNRMGNVMLDKEAKSFQHNVITLTRWRNLQAK